MSTNRPYRQPSSGVPPNWYSGLSRSLKAHSFMTELKIFKPTSISIVWEVRRGGSRRNCEWVGGDEPLPPFFRIGFFSFPKMDGSLRRHSTFFGGGFSPLKESLWRMKTAAAMLALIISILGLPHTKSNRPSRQRL